MITKVEHVLHSNETGMRKAAPGSSVSSLHGSNFGTMERGELNGVPSAVDGATGPG